MVMEKGGIGNNKLKISEKVSLSYNNMTVLYFFSTMHPSLLYNRVSLDLGHVK